MEQIIAHIDMDAFFASVEERMNPHLRGLPLVVGADPKGGRGRGVVSTANYAARVYGIHSAQPITKAWQLSEEASRKGNPKAVFLPVDFELYGPTSRRIMEILRRHAKLVEVASVDEAYLDLRFAGSFKNAEKLARLIKKTIKAKEGITASVGIGPNKLIAKIASGREKPDGLTIVPPGRVLSFLEPMSVREIPGIGPKTGAILAAKKIQTVGELREIPKNILDEWFGKWGSDLYEKARGIHNEPVVEEYETKSIGEQETFEKDTHDAVVLSKRLYAICESVALRMREEGFSGCKTVSIVVRFSDFETVTRAHTLKAMTNDPATIKANALRLFLPFLDSRGNPRKKNLRLLGVRLTHFEHDEQTAIQKPMQLKLPLA